MFERLTMDFALLMFMLPAIVGILVPVFVFIAGLSSIIKRRSKS
jgi:uncharacterized membrane protein